jgi:HAD superfamily hydrolase (TIGR01490 family)
MAKNNPLRVAIFDFDDTLFYGQSHSYFLSYIESKLPLLKFLYCKIRKRVVSKALTDRLNKEFLLEPFKEYSKEKIDNIAYAFYNDVIKKRLCKILLERYFEHKSNGDMVIIASGGFDVYLKYFEQEYNADLLISTKLAFQNNFFTGKIQGEEALSENKAFMVKSLLVNAKVDWSSSFAYSDHVSDIPLFNLVGNKNLVDIGQDKSWISSDFKIIKI